MKAKKKDPRGGHPNCGVKKREDRGEVKKTVSLYLTPNKMCKIANNENIKEAEAHCKLICYDALNKIIE